MILSLPLAYSNNFPLQQVCQNLRQVHCYHGVVALCLHRAALLSSGELPGYSLDDRDDRRAVFCAKFLENILQAVLIRGCLLKNMVSVMYVLMRGHYEIG